MVSEGHHWNCPIKWGHKKNCSKNNVCNDVSEYVYTGSALRKTVISVKIHACKIFILAKHNFKLYVLRKLSHFCYSDVSFVVSPSAVALPVDAGFTRVCGLPQNGLPP